MNELRKTSFGRSIKYTKHWWVAYKSNIGGSTGTRQGDKGARPLLFRLVLLYTCHLSSHYKDVRDKWKGNFPGHPCLVSAPALSWPPNPTNMSERPLQCSDSWYRKRAKQNKHRNKENVNNLIPYSQVDALRPFRTVRSAIINKMTCAGSWCSIFICRTNSVVMRTSCIHAAMF